MGSLRFRHHWVTSLSLFTLLHWRRKWQPTPVFWRIPGTGEPGGLPSMGSHRVGHDWSDLAAAAWGFLGSLAGKGSTCNAGNPGSILGSRRSPGEGIGYPLQYSWASLVAQMVKNPPARQRTWVWFLGREDPQEEGMVTHFSILAWRIPWTEESGYSPWGLIE